jgi:hypothetical protein
METQQLHQFYCESQHDEIIISFRRAMTHDRLEQVAVVLQKTLGSRPVAKRVLTVFVELAQNVLHYSLDRTEGEEDGASCGCGVLKISETADDYVVASGSVIGRKDAVRMKERISALCACSAEELKQRFLEQRRRPMQGGHAGLGLLLIARRSGGRIELRTEPHDQDRDFMVITAQIAKKGDATDE